MNVYICPGCEGRFRDAAAFVTHCAWDCPEYAAVVAAEVAAEEPQS